MMNTIELKDIQALIIEAADGAISEDELAEAGNQFKDLGMDSLTQMQLMVLLEEKYNIEADFEVAISEGVLDNYDNIVAFIERTTV